MGNFRRQNASEVFVLIYIDYPIAMLALANLFLLWYSRPTDIWCVFRPIYWWLPPSSLFRRSIEQKSSHTTWNLGTTWRCRHGPCFSGNSLDQWYLRLHSWLCMSGYFPTSSEPAILIQGNIGWRGIVATCVYLDRPTASRVQLHRFFMFLL